ncbi:D-amino acid dehydrogenase 1 [Usitatibacter palustris]|uniref:D-amino acid dehydrogenase 1 n=1 Tax=Usitatibacter palustris TaxID=2732487 RepID=A0A6M4HBK8_9PROT|nr:D-amino acid dehydrogenase 1 [Usitatibacter palustris]
MVGAGVVGASVALALAREGHAVRLIDRAEPGTGGASFGNAGHIATELVEPLPSPALLTSFWRELYALGGPLDIRLGHVGAFLPWALRFRRAAYRQKLHTPMLAPLVRAGADTIERWLSAIGRSDLLKRSGHYEIWLDERAAERAKSQAAAMTALEIRTENAEPEIVETARRLANASAAAGLWFPDCAHVLDPLEVVRAFVTAAIEHGATFEKATVNAMHVRGEGVELATDVGTIRADRVVICAGAWSAPLLTPFGLKVPLEAARGSHVEIPGAAALVDAPVLYSNEKIVATPMTGRLRATSYMEFAGADAPPDPSKGRRLRERLKKLGFDCPADGPMWTGSRPVLPDYLPGIGRVPGAPIYYSIGHQHVGLTIATPTAELLTDIMAGRRAAREFDLQRF